MPCSCQLGGILSNIFEKTITNKISEIDKNLQDTSNAVKLGRQGLENAALATKYYDTENYDIALIYIDKAIQCYQMIDPSLDFSLEMATVHWLKGRILTKLNRNDEAVMNYDTSLNIYPNIARVWLDKGISLSLLFRFDDSIRCFDSAIELDPQNATYYTEYKNYAIQTRYEYEKIKLRTATPP